MKEEAYHLREASPVPASFSFSRPSFTFFTPEPLHFWARTDLHQPSVLLSLLLRADQGLSGVHCCSCFVRFRSCYCPNWAASFSGDVRPEEGGATARRGSRLLLLPFQPPEVAWIVSSSPDFASSPDCFLHLAGFPVSSGLVWGTNLKLVTCISLFLNQF